MDKNEAYYWIFQYFKLQSSLLNDIWLFGKFVQVLGSLFKWMFGKDSLDF